MKTIVSCSQTKHHKSAPSIYLCAPIKPLEWIGTALRIKGQSTHLYIHKGQGSAHTHKHHGDFLMKRSSFVLLYFATQREQDKGDLRIQYR